MQTWSLFPRRPKTNIKHGNVHAFIWTITMNNEWTPALHLRHAEKRVCVRVPEHAHTQDRLLWEQSAWRRPTWKVRRSGVHTPCPTLKASLVSLLLVISGVSAFFCDWYIWGLLRLLIQARLHKGRFIGPGTASLGRVGLYYLTRFFSRLPVCSQKPVLLSAFVSSGKLLIGPSKPWPSDKRLLPSDPALLHLGRQNALESEKLLHPGGGHQQPFFPEKLSKKQNFNPSGTWEIKVPWERWCVSGHGGKWSQVLQMTHEISQDLKISY